MKTISLFFLLLMSTLAIGQANTNSVMTRLGQSGTTINFPLGTTTYGKFNTFYGYSSGLAAVNATEPEIGWENTYIGANTGVSNLGMRNSFFGFGAGFFNTGSHNTLIGNGAASSNVTGEDNTIIGVAAGAVGTSGNENVYLGRSAGYMSSGSRNVIIGARAGEGSTGAPGSGNVFIGYQAGHHESGDNMLRIQNSFNTTLPLVDGNFATQDIKFNANTVIYGNAANATGLTFQRMINTSITSPHTVPGAPVLSIEKTTGRVVLVPQIAPIAGQNIILTPPTGSPGAGWNFAAKNIYTHDGTLTGNRTVTMSGNRMIFNTGAGNTGGIYIGNNAPLFDATSFPTTFGNYKLYVDGGILSERVKVALKGGSPNNWADYVFADGYALTPLNEVEAFVKANKHLPGVPSAQELARCGLDLGDMQAIQMEKIEELTLHLIEQNKELENQNRIMENQSEEIQVLKQQVKALIEKSK